MNSPIRDLSSLAAQTAEQLGKRRQTTAEMIGDAIKGAEDRRKGREVSPDDGSATP